MKMASFYGPEPVGDTAVTLSVKEGRGAETVRLVRGLADKIREAAIRGIVDVVASPGRVTVGYDPLAVANFEELRAAVAAAAAGAGGMKAGRSLEHEIPVSYDGPDLEQVCSLHGIEPEQVIARHTEPEYIVEAIGFLPGFGYLAGLPASLATPRLKTPRIRVPAGSVGIGGGQTGVYPFSSPGGWNLIGRTNARLFDLGRPRPALFDVGDRVRFVKAELPPPVASETAVPRERVENTTITVIEPGLFTTVQDLGRPRHRASGVPLSGAADGVSLRLANLLVGNPESAAGLECTLLGPTLRFDQDAVIALVGSPFPGLPLGVATRVPAGTVVPLGHATRGCRGYLAVAGGIDVEPVLGSRSTLLTAGLGGFAGRPLAKGDCLTAGEPERTLSQNGPPTLVRGLTTPERPCVLRIIPGEHAGLFGNRPWSQTYCASSRSDRMGTRLDGEPVEGSADGAGMASVAVFPGTVQVPPDGRPIVLLADAQTIGGYPVLGHVIAADLPRAAQLRPGDEVHWAQVSLSEAHAALREREAVITAVRETLR